MSEYQYYEFQAVDRLLDAQAQKELRAISSRARITASSFVNSYDWGDLKADPLKLVARYFDLFVYVANWGTRWFAIKLPKAALDLGAVRCYQLDNELLALQTAGEHIILSINRGEVEDEDWDDGSGWLAALAPLRSELLAGDLRLFALLWLIEVEDGTVDDQADEPPPGVGPLTPALAALAEFLCIDGDLIEAAAGSAPAAPQFEPPPSEVERFLRALPEDEKVALLLRLHADEPHLGAELRRRVSTAVRSGALAAASAGQPARRTAGELRAKAQCLAAERERRAEEKTAAERRRLEAEAAQAQAKRLQALAQRGEAVWQEVDALIALRNAAGYERATALLSDLGALADQNDAYEGFARRISDLRAQHAGKYRFIERLDAAGLPRASWPHLSCRPQAPR